MPGAAIRIVGACARVWRCGRVNVKTAGRILLEDVLGLNAGDRILLYSDLPPDRTVIQSLQKQAVELGMDAEVCLVGDLPTLQAMVEQLSSRVRAGHFAAICELSEQYFYPTRVWGLAVEAGCKVYGLGPLDERALIGCVGEVDHAGLARFGQTLHRLLVHARKVRIESEAGTSFSCRMTGRGLVARLLGRLPSADRSTVWPPCGVPTVGTATFLGGQSSFLGIPGSMNGTLVIDGYLWPPRTVGPVQDPITIEVVAGNIQAISGAPAASAALSNWLCGQSPRVEHFCVGYNPGATLGGSLMEAERAFGHLNVGVGRYPRHADGVMKMPRITIDGAVLMERGTFTHPKLVELARALGH